MGKKCDICRRRKSKYFINVHISAGVEQVKEMCWACSKRYLSLREKHLAAAYKELVDKHKDNL